MTEMPRRQESAFGIPELQLAVPGRDAPRPAESERLTIIDARQTAGLSHLRELWDYRDLLVELAVRDIKVRYKQTVLGCAWAVIQPVMLMAVFSLVLGRLAIVPSDGVPYPVFVYAGLLVWLFFQNAVTAAANSLVGSESLVTKVYFPRLIIPLAATASALVDLLVGSSVLVALMAWHGMAPTTSLALAPLLVVPALLAALGAGTLLAALNVAYRDFRYVVPFLLQLWMFATPVVYPASLVPADWSWALHLNPMAGAVTAFRGAVLGTGVDAAGLAVSTLIALLVLAAAMAHFAGVERRFADVI